MNEIHTTQTESNTMDIINRTAEITYGSWTATFTITGTTDWAGGKHTRIYLDIDHLDYCREVKSAYIDTSNTATLNIYDMEIETDAGRVIVECSDKLSHKKADALKFAFYDLLDN